MSETTKKDCRNFIIYEIYVRNHGPNGNFSDVEKDLDRIKSLGVDVIWFMPIHPIGLKERKGALGSPYSIQNYREINPEYGTLADFQQLLEKAHSLGLKVMIDVVFNHTAHDSVLLQDHPDWYHQNALGDPITTVPEWSDIIDLSYPNEDLENYLVESLKMWVRLGMDGFRCDVASIVSLSFWLRAKKEISEINPHFFWLAESVHAGFVGSRREANLTAFSDGEVFSAFDMEYDYDIWPIWQAAVKGELPVSRYLEMLRYQNCIFPKHFIKMRCVENHDQARIMALAPTSDQALAWTAFQIFNKGSFLIYAGQEAGAVHTPSLFEDDKIQWNTYPLQSFFTTLLKFKKEPVVSNGTFTVPVADPAILACWEPKPGTEGDCFLGVFNVNKNFGKINVPIPDGDYTNYLTDETIPVRYGQIDIPPVASILRYEKPVFPAWFYSTLIDFHIPSDSQG